MYTIARFLIDKSAFAVVPVVAAFAWNLPYVAPAIREVNPWAAEAPPPSEQLASVVAGFGERFGIGSAQAAGGDGRTATQAYQKARITQVYAQHRYNQKATARALGTDVAGLQRMLRRHGIIEWPEGHGA